MSIFTPCRSCGAPMLWAATEDGGRIPLDVDPVDPAGTHTFVLRDGGKTAMAVPPSVFSEEPHYVTHFSTCPDADEWRGQRRSDMNSAIPLAEGTSKGEDPDLGRIFDVPRIAVIVDESDPTVIKLAWSGSVELDRGNAAQVEFFNKLEAGDSRDVVVSIYVAGAKMSHRRDSEGEVDAVVQTKSLVVNEVYLDLPGS